MVRALTPQQLQLITLPPPPQKLPERSLSFGAAEVRALPAQGSAQSLWHTHICTCRPHRYDSEDKMSPIFISFWFFRHTEVPSAPGTHLIAVTAVSDQSLPGQSRHRTPGKLSRKNKKCLQSTIFRAGLHFSPWLPVPHPAAMGNVIHLLKVKMKHYKHSPRSCSSLPVCSSTVSHSAPSAKISAQKKPWVNLFFNSQCKNWDNLLLCSSCKRSNKPGFIEDCSPTATITKSWNAA